jgi:NAD(P)-dependent dehydrogenase (short-subunit alcohol dehydrogenase family)
LHAGYVSSDLLYRGSQFRFPAPGYEDIRAFVHKLLGRRQADAASATKAAVRSFARTWTTDLKKRRIRVNAVSPGSIDTPGLCDLLASSETGQQRLKMIHSAVPLGRLGTPEEIAKAVVFLASDDSSYVTGTELFVDGGFAQV